MNEIKTGKLMRARKAEARMKLRMMMRSSRMH